MLKKTGTKVSKKTAKKAAKPAVKDIKKKTAVKALPAKTAARKKSKAPEKNDRIIKSIDPATMLADLAIKGIQEKKGKNIKRLDLREIGNRVCDYFIICEGDSTTQVDAIAKSIEYEIHKATKERPYRTEGYQNSEWILLDYVNVVVHVFQKEIRNFYKLETLWADAETQEFE